MLAEMRITQEELRTTGEEMRVGQELPKEEMLSKMETN
jgi:hypothetical protein